MCYSPSPDKVNVKLQRFIPSEFGNDVDRTNPVEPAKTNFAEKAKIRRAIEAQGIPYTYIISACFAGIFLPTMAQPGATAPPRDKVVILGDGTAKGIVSVTSFHYEQLINVATYCRQDYNFVSSGL